MTEAKRLFLRWVGAADTTRRDKTKDAWNRRICLSLSWRLGAGPASSLLVVLEGVLGVIRSRDIALAPTCLTLQFLVPYSFVFFSRRFFKTYPVLKEIVEDRLLLLAADTFILFLCFSRFFLRQSLCGRPAWLLYYTNEAARPTTRSKVVQLASDT